MHEMLKYTCIKTVKAAPMDRLTAQEVLNRQIKTPHASDEGYLVEYEDGYQSWSPKEVFEQGYVLAETYVDRMKFELKELRERIAKGTLAYLNPDIEMKGAQRAYLGMQLRKMNEYAEVLCNRIQTATGKCESDEGD